MRAATSITARTLNDTLMIDLAGPTLPSGNVSVRVTDTDPAADDLVGVIEDLAGNHLASFDRLAETFSNDAEHWREIERGGGEPPGSVRPPNQAGLAVPSREMPSCPGAPGRGRHPLHRRLAPTRSTSISHAKLTKPKF